MTKQAEKRDAQTLQTENINDQTAVIPVTEEEIVVNKRVVESGSVRLSKRISEREEIVDVPLLREEVSFERVPVNRVVETAPAPRQEGNVMIIPIVEEQVFVQKRLVVVEELRITKQVVEDRQQHAVTLAKEEVEIKRSVG